MQVTINLLRAQHEDIARAVGVLMALFDLRYARPRRCWARPAPNRAGLTKHLKSEDELLLTPLRERRLMASIPDARRSWSRRANCA